jgi:ClpP class serine protease
MLDRVGLKLTYVYAGRFKTEGNEHEPLGDEARGELQRRVDEAYNQFVGALARGRKVTRATVEANFGQGRVFSAVDAEHRKMADRVATWPDTLDLVRRQAAGLPDARTRAHLDFAQSVVSRVSRQVGPPSQADIDLEHCRLTLRRLQRVGDQQRP